MGVKREEYNGKMIVLAFPDTFVKFSHEKVSKLLPLVGLGRKGIIKAGHAAFILIENATGKASYYDFGRYITPFGYGRVRSADTDMELHIPFKASIGNKSELLNLKEFLIWLEAHPEKTHGSGRLIASVCSAINYEKAFQYVSTIQNQGSIPYYTFKKKGTNCSRIVTDTILAATNEPRIIRPLLRNKKFTPSPLGNVEKARLNSPIYKIENGIISYYDQKVFKENMTNYFKRQKTRQTPLTSINPVPNQEIAKAQLLTGIGSDAYFLITTTSKKEEFLIKRFTKKGRLDFKGLFISQSPFNPSESYQFTYDSHCKYCHVLQNGQKIKFERIKVIFPEF